METLSPPVRIFPKPKEVNDLPTVDELKKSMEDSFKLLHQELLRARERLQSLNGCMGFGVYDEEDERKRSDERIEAADKVEMIRAQKNLILSLYRPFQEYYDWQAWKDNEDRVERMMGE